MLSRKTYQLFRLELANCFGAMNSTVVPLKEASVIVHTEGPALGAAATVRHLPRARLLPQLRCAGLWLRLGRRPGEVLGGQPGELRPPFPKR